MRIDSFTDFMKRMTTKDKKLMNSLGTDEEIIEEEEEERELKEDEVEDPTNVKYNL